ncbi:hypothetical protein [Bradyrhizobium diazoefficiens]|uniref:Uncharacterized protein n=1 Tax=Bradyrhizobium diazoefficiens TaxID=1355477 RepID=A0A809Y9B6_9BRAD|nr:hypothetical protein [Bradyrhizobium diazoefficiens]BCA00454.1 hypothetical protein H12S4_13580 [Bradyrhizobium diazoefficiens]BCA18136.1 hypothetical protein BDHH15_13510 [Bradyrhizobium diazoefficiens]BCE36319.1 hypothetical protein XF3B_13500 [Bradyrhizobium diazoefficiens]BCF49711.1 hypothetical protein XF17B_13490 [Bradyrhizobium diazoefficiens]
MDTPPTSSIASAIAAAKAAKLEERRERHRKNAKEHYWRTLQTEPRKAMLHNAQRAARRFNVPINITLDDIVIPARCPAYDIPLRRSNGVAGEASPSVLRIEPQLGYVKGNVIVVSAKAARDPLARTLLFRALKAAPRGEVLAT